LVVTYTNAAASEIKLKLYNELNKLIQTIDDINKKEFLKKQLDNINNAEIGTLHAICRKLIVKYFYEIEQSPDFALLSDKEQKYLLDMAVNNVFGKRINSNDEEFFELYDCYNSNRNDMKLKKIALQLYDFKMSKTDYEDWKNQFINNSYNTDTSQNITCAYLLEHYQKRVLGFSYEVIKLKKLAEEGAFEKYFNFLNCRYQFINEFSSAPDFKTAVKILDNVSFVSKPKCTDKTPIDEKEFDEQVVYFHHAFGSLITSIQEDFTSTDISVIENNILRAKNNVTKLLQIVDEIEENYNLIKKNKNVLDFNDLEEKMLKLLESDNIRSDLKSQYKYIFVDEYQDINYKQETILLNLVSGDNYYMIGDVKQSIYAFRQSSPEIFINKYNEFSKPDNNDQVINFNINYRSDRNILEFANSVFDKIITRNTIGIDYISDARFQSKKSFVGCNVDIGIINTNDELEDADVAEAKLIIEQISNVIATKKSDGSYYDYGDIAIILRSRGAFVSTLCQMMIDHQIPVKASINSDFFGTSEIELMIAILKVVSNFKDDVSISVVLKNLFGVNEEELLAIRKSNTDLDFCDAVLQYSNDDLIKQKIAECFEFISNSRKKLTRMTIRDFLSNVIEEFDIDLKLKTKINGIEKSNNIKEFLRISDNTNYQYNIDAFLDYLDIISKDDTPKNIGASNNAVEICTIHHSKGLEYPVVILGRLGKKFQLNKDSGNIIMNGDFGVGLKSIDVEKRTLEETVVRSACKLANKKSEIDEEIRLLYVAMTRAKEKLIMLGAYDVSKLATNKLKDVYFTITPFDMIFKSIENVYLPHFENKNEFVINENAESEARVKIYGQDDFDCEEVLTDHPIILDTVNDDLKNKLQTVFDLDINTKITTIKNTVTNIMREECDYENLNFLPNKLDSSDKVPSFDALKLGTAYHFVMQNINFNENYLDIESLINDLIANGQIEKDLVKLIKIDEILKCISVLKPIIDGSDQIYKEKQFLLCENYNKLVEFSDNNTKVIIQGVIDLVIKKDDKVYLIDYKTNRGVSEDDLKKAYALQIKIYADAFELATGIKISNKYLYSFKLGKLIEVV